MIIFVIFFLTSQYIFAGTRRAESGQSSQRACVSLSSTSDLVWRCIFVDDTRTVTGWDSHEFPWNHNNLLQHMHVMYLSPYSRLALV